MQLPKDFSEFLKLFNSKKVKYLLVGGYAVGYYGYPRATNDIDLWVEMSPENAEKIVHVLREFGFAQETLNTEIFLKDEQIIRMGVPPLRIEILTGVSGIKFAEAFTEKETANFADLMVDIISLENLKTNKKAAGRHKDLDDLENLP